MSNENLMSIEDYENIKRGFYHFDKNVKTNIACPKCNEEMLETSPGVVLTSYPPKKAIYCPKCNFSTSVIY